VKQLFFLIIILATTTAQAGIIEWLTGRTTKFDPKYPHTIIENLSAQKQENSNWCWAAVTRMMMSSKTSNLPSQCEIVSQTFGIDCCSNNFFKCNRPYYPAMALTKFGYKFKVGKAKFYPERHWSERIDNQGWYESVIEQIKNGNSVGITRYNYAGSTDNSTHIVLAYGTFNKNGKDYLLIFDPWEGTTKTWDESYVTGNLAWTDTITLE
jgi:hypothetical protein